MTDKQPEALRLADELQNAARVYPQLSEEAPGGYASEFDQNLDCAAIELRRQHARIERLEATLQMLIDHADLSDDAKYGTLATYFVRENARAALEDKA